MQAESRVMRLTTHRGHWILSESMRARQNQGSNTPKSAKIKSRHCSCAVIPRSVICARPVVKAKQPCQQKAVITRRARDGHMVLSGDARRLSKRYRTPHVHTKERASNGIMTKSRASASSHARKRAHTCFEDPHSKKTAGQHKSMQTAPLRLCTNPCTVSRRHRPSDSELACMHLMSAERASRRGEGTRVADTESKARTTHQTASMARALVPPPGRLPRC